MLSDVEVAVKAAQAGAAVVRARYGKPLARFDKGAGQPTQALHRRRRGGSEREALVDFATAADIEAERVILEVLRSERPDDAVIGEETGLSGTGERLWLVDPLCGTRNFAAQTPLFAVNVALRDGPAACADPFTGEVFRTDGELVPSAESRLVELDLDTGSATARLLADASFRELFSPRVVSTSLALTWVAIGRRAAYVVDRDVRDSVHFAAGIALCQAAGCVVTGLLGQPLHTGAGGLIAAADRATHEALADIISRQF